MKPHTGLPFSQSIVALLDTPQVTRSTPDIQGWTRWSQSLPSGCSLSREERHWSDTHWDKGHKWKVQVVLRVGKGELLWVEFRKILFEEVTCELKPEQWVREKSCWHREQSVQRTLKEEQAPCMKESRESLCSWRWERKEESGVRGVELQRLPEPKLHCGFYF